MMHMPDYFDGEQWYEIQGCGRDQMIKLKVNKLEDQRQWQGFTEYPVMYWFYDSHNKASTAMSLTAINYLVTQEEFVLQTFPEGHQYWEMPTSTFNWVPLG